MRFLIWVGFLFLSHSVFAQTADLKVQINHASSDQGKILVLVFNSEKGFPESIDQAFQRLVLVPKNKKVEFTLENIPSGKYAITVLHDEDNNGKMSTSLMGFPQEKYGFSNNPKIYFGPPSFEKAAILLGRENKTVQINLR
ncbi:DUF2141 domain-containing protein [Algoriphagus mannitolivorans]|uniref:DUF2141 domain-containing protein n=1 Tax=Algoriphagus mannitolivorans TaxID=226504 RepID=UPI00042076BC|nr:DUF2141 domain-containing protein [Algoriphagus mannitolivorans]